MSVGPELLRSAGPGHGGVPPAPAYASGDAARDPAGGVGCEVQVSNRVRWLLLKIGLPITAPIATLVLFWALVLKLLRDTDDDPAAFRPVSVLLVVASILYIVPQVYGMEAADQAYLGSLPSSLISSENLGLARPILWASLGLFSLTGAALFGRFLMRLGGPRPESEPEVPPVDAPDSRRRIGVTRGPGPSRRCRSLPSRTPPRGSATANPARTRASGSGAPASTRRTRGVVPPPGRESGRRRR